MAEVMSHPAHQWIDAITCQSTAADQLIIELMLILFARFQGAFTNTPSYSGCSIIYDRYMAGLVIMWRRSTYLSGVDSGICLQHRGVTV
jgi:hypothetical protein